MFYFLIGVLFMYSIVATYLIYRFYKLYKSKVTAEDVQNYLLDNFLEVDINV